MMRRHEMWFPHPPSLRLAYATPGVRGCCNDAAHQLNDKVIFISIMPLAHSTDPICSALISQPMQRNGHLRMDNDTCRARKLLPLHILIYELIQVEQQQSVWLTSSCKLRQGKLWTRSSVAFKYFEFLHLVVRSRWQTLLTLEFSSSSGVQVDLHKSQPPRIST